MNDVPVIILCGGRGVFLEGGRERTAKPLVRVLDRPMFSHVVAMYERAGFRRFVLCSGYQHDALVRAVDELYPKGSPSDVRVLDTGLDTLTGERVRRALASESCAPAKTIAIAYSDTVADLDTGAVLADHRAHGKLGTLVAARMPLRFRVLGLRDGDRTVRGFAARPVIQRELINGGFYVFERAALAPPYLPESGGILESHVLESLAPNGELVAHAFEGAWQFLDSERDLPAVERIVRGDTTISSVRPGPS
jgi:glucose-1-phosphate cytidylyltransferase